MNGLGEDSQVPVAVREALGKIDSVAAQNPWISAGGLSKVRYHLTASSGWLVHLQKRIDSYTKQAEEHKTMSLSLELDDYREDKPAELNFVVVATRFLQIITVNTFEKPKADYSLALNPRFVPSRLTKLWPFVSSAQVNEEEKQICLRFRVCVKQSVLQIVPTESKVPSGRLKSPYVNVSIAHVCVSENSLSAAICLNDDRHAFLVRSVVYGYKGSNNFLTFTPFDQQHQLSTGHHQKLHLYFDAPPPCKAPPVSPSLLRADLLVEKSSLSFSSPSSHFAVLDLDVFIHVE